MKKSLYLLLSVCFLVSLRVYSQPSFSLPDANKMVLDPAFTGIDTSYKRTISIYAQGEFPSPSSSSTDILYHASITTFQMNLDKINSGVGIMLNYNELPQSSVFSTRVTIHQTAVKLYYRYTIFPGLSIGADAGFVTLKGDYVTYDFSPWGLYYHHQYEENLNNFDFDAGAGVLYKLKSFYIGASIDHINNPQATFPGVPGTDITYSNIPMPNYSGIVYNATIGGFIGTGSGGIDLSASYRNFNLNENITIVVSHFFVGFSMLEGNYFNGGFYPYGSYITPDKFNGNDDYIALICGIKAYHKKIKISVACSFPLEGIQPSLMPLEGEISYSF